MIGARTVCVSAALVLGCQSVEGPPRGARKGFEPPPEYAEQLPAEPEQPPPPPITPEPPAAKLADLGGAEEAEQKPERDLGAELKAALGSPSDCVRDFVANTATTIRISVTAIVRPTGMVIEPSAYGGGVSAAALSCVRQRLGTVVLDPLDDTVSSTVATVIEIAYEPPVVIESDPGVPEPKLKNVVEPLPKRPEVAPSGKPIQKPTSKPIEGGEKTERPISGPEPKKISGPKPRAIDGYEVDENAQEWR